LGFCGRCWDIAAGCCGGGSGWHVRGGCSKWRIRCGKCMWRGLRRQECRAGPGTTGRGRGRPGAGRGARTVAVVRRPGHHHRASRSCPARLIPPGAKRPVKVSNSLTPPSWLGKRRRVTPQSRRDGRRSPPGLPEQITKHGEGASPEITTECRACAASAGRTGCPRADGTPAKPPHFPLILHSAPRAVDLKPPSADRTKPPVPPLSFCCRTHTR
jgi:hypothetical protein